MKPYLNINFNYNRFNLANEGVFNDGFMSFDLNAEVNILPYDTFTPYVFGGFGTNAFNDFNSIDPKLQIGVGFEYLVSNNIGLTIYGEHNYVFNDELDGLDIGKNDDMFYRVGAGLNVYFTQPKNKFNQNRLLERQKRRELIELKKLNTQALKENRRSKRVEPEDKNKEIEDKPQTEEKSEIEEIKNILDQKEQRKLNIKIMKEQRRAAKRAARDAKKNDKTIINANKIENDEN